MRRGEIEMQLGELTSENEAKEKAEAAESESEAKEEEQAPESVGEINEEDNASEDEQED
jgi:hypothetical protein